MEETITKSVEYLEICPECLGNRGRYRRGGGYIWFEACALCDGDGFRLRDTRPDYTGSIVIPFRVITRRSADPDAGDGDGDAESEE